MLKTVIFVVFVLIIALVGGAGSAWLALESTRSIGSVEIGPWVTFPNQGTRKADPYSRARSRRLGQLSLGQAEGVVLVAAADSDGRPLLRQCTYRIQGELPPTRFFTLHAVDDNRTILSAPARFLSALHSQDLLWRDGQTLGMIVSPHPQPDNWMAIAGTGSMQLVLTLVDTPISTGARVGETSLPVISRVGCDA
ncbi:DUF1214 domain-containing protein [Nitratireductor kimnyeongensis]|uniref:DUF1214 domain-containing protein n=1 Tax=Nitratireductor kimnyeongensis TaxID=430679 RepID=A0ABW0T3I9_9HYPH|nr:DUF1214 domain-containing protein [Nitratireductor kimnyeongensis]QZZ34999.1 DUF1214 domain-containing protein [Nitratireductor kimnyeongensis]